MKQYAKYFTTVVCLINVLIASSGCAYGPALLGSELPIVPLPAPDTVQKVNTYLLGHAAWPGVYGTEDKNFLAGVGVQRTVSLPFDRRYNSIAWSYAYGGMAYQGNYQLYNTSLQQFGLSTKSYYGGLLHGAVRFVRTVFKEYVSTIRRETRVRIVGTGRLASRQTGAFFGIQVKQKYTGI